MAGAIESMLLCHSVCCWVLLAGNTQEAGCKAMLILHISKDKRRHLELALASKLCLLVLAWAARPVTAEQRDPHC